MTNPFLLSSIEDQQAQPPANANPFALQAVQNDQRQDLRNTLTGAVRENPDQAARAAQLTKRYPAPVDVLARNLMNVELQAAVDKADETLRTSPKLAKAVREKSWLAPQAHDDFPPLAALETKLNQRADRTALGTLGDISVVALKGAIGLPQAFVGLADILTGGYAGKGVEATGVRFAEAQKLLDTLYSPAQKQANEAVREADGFISTLGAMLSNPSTIATTVGESAPQMVGGAALGRGLLAAAPKLAPWLAAAFGEGLMGAGSSAEQIRSETDDGLLSAKQVFASTMSGAGTALFGAVGGRAAQRLGLADIDTALVARGVDNATAKTLQRGFITRIAGAGVSEGVFEELPQSIQEQLWQNWATDRPLGEGVGKAAAQGLLAGLSMGGGFQAASEAGAALQRRLVERESAIDRAQTEGQRLTEALQTASQSKLRERNPETFEQLVNAMSEGADGAPQSVYIDAQVLLQSATAEELAQILPSTVEQLQEAATSNGTIEVPVAEALTYLPGTPLEQVFLQNARSAPNAMSLADADQASKQAEQFLAQEADRVLQQAADTQAWQQSSEQVKQAVLTQLNSTGRFTPDVNDAYATLQANFFSTMAARVGMTPQELYGRYSLKVAAKQVGQGGVLNAPAFARIDTFNGLKLRRASADIKVSAASAFADGPFTIQPGVQEIPLADVALQGGDLFDSPAQQQRIADLAAQIQKSGSIEPLFVAQRADGTRYVAEGQHRARALISLGYTSVPARVMVEQGVFNQSATIRRGTETLKKYGLNPGKSYKTREVAAALEARQRAKYGTIAADDRSPEALAKISKWMQAEVEFAMDNPESSGVGWYSEKFQRALDTMAQQFPELATDKVARDTMTALIAITSDGQKVVPNFAQAMDIYGNFKATGKFTTTRGTQRQASVDGNLAVVQRLHDMMGAEAMHEYLMQEKTISELKKLAKANGGDLKSDYQAHIKMPMAAVEFGPKLGAFYANLMGAHGYLTMDRWWSRSFNRYRGTLLQAPTRQGLDRFKELLGNPALSDDEAIAATVEPRNAYEAKGFKNGTELEKAANTIYKAAFENLEDAPFNATDRTFMLDAVNKAQKSLSRKGYNLSVADIQAILWYYEKRLYGELGARQTADISYEEAAQRVVAGYASGQGIESLLDGTAAALENGGADQGRVPVGEEPFNAGGVNDRLEQAGDGAGRAADAGSSPLPGAPVIAGATGPDPRLVAVAEQYARDNGIDLKRQSEYVQVDPERAARIAAAYEAMAHAPQDPAVKEAYENLIQQTLAQYRALEAAGYKFWFIDPTNDPYKSPFDAMREMRASQTMGVFPTVAGFGSNDTNPFPGNPLEADTGIQWPYGSPDGELRPVLANDLFRAVHDAFGHGLEGAGFRAQGEENAWQAHARLFTGSAVAAITTETRGQNSWVNFGPNGESNQTATAEDTKFADQKTGLLPEFAWSEGRAGDMQSDVLEQGPRGTFSPSQLLLTLNENADLSTFLHESGHFFLEVMADLASQANTPQQIKDDMAATLAWFGVPDLATWNNYTLDEKRPYHERWAESFEQYLFEGKAPSPELQPLFRRFRSWMVNVYKSLTEFMRARNLKVNDEVRQVFGRLIATDEQIAQAEEAAGLLPDFDATNEAIEQLQARSLRDLKWTVRARGKVLKALEKEAKALRKDVEAEVRAEVEATTEMRAKAALDALRKSTSESKAALADWNTKRQAARDQAAETIKENLLATEGAGLEGLKKGQFLAKNKRRIANEAEAAALQWERENPKPERAMVGSDIEVATVADSFGYTSVEEMLQAIDAFGRKEDAIEGMTDQRMLERHGELATPEALEAAANEAVHNEARAKSLATELKSQAEMLNPRQDTGRTASNGRPITVNAITAAAKQFAANLAARRRIKDLKNAAWQHRSAEARAGKAWQAATAKADTQAAVQAKRDQVLNNAAVKALQDAQVEVKKILEFFKRVTKGNDEKVVERGRDPDVVNAMRAILGAYDVAPRLEKTALAYMETVAKNDPVMYAALQPSVQGAMLNAKPLTEMTMEELRGLNDELRAMWSLAKSSRQMEVDGNLIDIEEAADQLVARMGEIGIPDTIPGEKGAITDKQERGIKLQFAKAILSRVEQWSERLDGKFGGPFLRLVFQPVKDAADRYRTDKVAYRKKFTELLKNVAPALPAGPIEAPELGYTFGNARDSGAAELLHAILHTGNDSNKRKLLLGRGWATQDAEGNLDTTQWDAFIQRMQDEGKINKVHYDFAQGVWDLLEEMKPLAQDTHRKVFGRYFAEVTANEVVTPFGTYRGGYLPAQTDSRLVKDAKLRELAEGENESMAYAFPAAPSGFTKSRVEYNQPLLLDLRALGQHMDKVLLFSHMQGAVTDVRRLLTNKRVSYLLDRLDPGAYEGMLIPWLNRSARQVVETPVVGDRKLSRFLSAARSRAGMALMFANLSNTVQQITGFTLASVKVKPGLMMQATARFIADPKAMKTTVADASPYMKDRMLNEVGAMNDAIEEILVDPTLLERGQAWTQRHAYFMQAAVDNTMSPIIWTAAYNQSIEQGMDERDAVRFADGVIRQTQGTTLPEDISRFESGPGYARLFTQFVSYFNMMANTNATAVKQITDEMGLKKGAGKVLYVAIAGLLAPIWVAEAIAHAFRGGPEDEDKDGWLDDWLLAVFGLGTIRGLTAQIPIVGQAAQLVVNRFNDNPADDKFSLSPAISLIESTVSAPSSVYKAIVDDGNKQKAVRDVAAAATMITGLPIFGIARPLGYLAGVAGGDIEPTGPADLARGLVTGTASPESKQR